MKRETGGSRRISRKRFDAVIFDLNGVITKTARVHAAAWKRLFDEYLQAWVPGAEYEPFDRDADYRNHIDGKPRYEGVRAFLASRGIRLPQGHPSDSAESETICGVR